MEKSGVSVWPSTSMRSSVPRYWPTDDENPADAFDVVELGVLERVLSANRRERRLLGEPRTEDAGRFDAAARDGVGDTRLEPRALGQTEAPHDEIVNLEDARQLVRLPRGDLQAGIVRDDLVDDDRCAGRREPARQGCCVQRPHRGLQTTGRDPDVGAGQGDVAEPHLRSNQAGEWCAGLEGTHRDQRRQVGVGIAKLNAQPACRRWPGGE